MAHLALCYPGQHETYSGPIWPSSTVYTSVKNFFRSVPFRLLLYAPATIPTPRPSLAYLAHKPFNTTLPRSQVIPVIAMLPMTAITSPSIIGPIISQGNLPTLISTWPNFCGPLLILVVPVTDWCQPTKIFCPGVLVKIWR